MVAELNHDKAKRTGTFSVLAVSLFTFTYLTVGMVISARQQNWEFVFYIPIVLMLGALTLAIRRRAGLTLATLWLLSLWGLLHVVGGTLEVPAGWPVEGDKRSFYSLELIPGILVYDKPVHAFGFGVATWVCWQGICAMRGSSHITLGSLMLAALAGMGLGATNEVIEFIASQTMETNVGGYVNTGGDLIANGIGALAAIGLIAVCTPKRDSHR